LLARQLGKLKKKGGASVDGSKFRANASKHKAVSYKRAGEIIEEPRGQVTELMQTADEADGKGLEDGLFANDEILRREDRIAKPETAKAAMERMYAEARAEGSKKGKKLEEYRHNFTGGDSRIMKAGGGNHFEQSYNAQAAADTEGSMLILGGYVTQNGNDKKELEPAVSSIPAEVREVTDVSADSGYYSGEAVAAVEKVNEKGEREGPEVFCDVGKSRHGRTVEDLKKKPSHEEEGPVGNMSAKEKMSKKLGTKEGKEIYKKRKETVGPVFGIIKHVMGFRQFMLRGIDKVNTEWELVKVAYNFKRLYNLLGGRSLSKCPAYGKT
jgi:hypothetical protein